MDTYRPGFLCPPALFTMVDRLFRLIFLYFFPFILLFTFLFQAYIIHVLSFQRRSKYCLNPAARL